MKSVEIPLPDELHDQLKRLAEQNHIALSDLLLALISKALQNASEQRQQDDDLVHKLTLVQEQLRSLSDTLNHVAHNELPDDIIKH